MSYMYCDHPLVISHHLMVSAGQCWGRWPHSRVAPEYTQTNIEAGRWVRDISWSVGAEAQWESVRLSIEGIRVHISFLSCINVNLDSGDGSWNYKLNILQFLLLLFKYQSSKYAPYMLCIEYCITTIRTASPKWEWN